MVNDRVKKIADRATEYAATSLTLGAVGTSEFHEKFAEKFAEPLIGDVLDFLNNEHESYLSVGTYEPLEYYDRMNAKADAISFAIDCIEYNYLKS